jgi:hypothetical protein
MQKDAKKKRLKPDKLDHLLNGSFATDDKIDEGLQLDQYLLWWESLQSQERYEQLAKIERKTAPIAGARRVDNIILELLKNLQVKKTTSIFKKGTGSSKEDLKKYQEIMYAHQIVNTIEYLILFFPNSISGNNSIKKEILDIRKKQGQDVDQNKTISMSFVNTAIAALDDLTSNGGDNGISSFQRHVLNCSYVHCNELDGTHPGDERDEPPIVSFTTSGDTPFVFRFLKEILSDRCYNVTVEEKTPLIYAEMLDTIHTMLLPKNLPQQLRTLPYVARTTFLALVHMLQEFITIRPVLHIEFLKSMYEVLETYTRWPVPYCDVANQCRSFLRTEAESPGAAFRRRLFNTLPLLNPPTHGMNKPGGKYTEMLKLWHEFGNTTAVLYDLDVNVSRNECRPEVMASLMEQDPTRPGPEVGSFDSNNCANALERAQRSIIVQVVGTYFEVTESVLGLDDIDPTQLGKICNGILAIAKSSLRPIEYFNGPGFPSWPKEEMYAIEATRKEAIRRFVELRIKSKLELVERISERSTQLPNYPYHGIDIIFKGFPVKTDKHLDWRKGSVLSMPKYRKQLQLLFRTAACPACDEQDKTGSLRPTPLRIAILGGTSSIHRFLCAYAALLEEYPDEDFQSSVDLQLFLLPCLHSDVAAYLAENDGWYRRQVFSPFRNIHRSVLPGLKVTKIPAEGHMPKIPQTTKNSLEIETPAPAPMFLPRLLLEDFTEGANRSLNVCVYDILCWCASDSQCDSVAKGFILKSNRHFPNDDLVKAGDDNTRETDEHMKIPMFGRIEIGLGVCMEEFRLKERKDENRSWMFEDSKNSPGKKKGKKKNLDDDLTWRNLLKDKDFLTFWKEKYTTPDLSISFREVDVHGTPRPLTQALIRKPMPYASITVSNINKYKGNNDIGPDPCVPCPVSTQPNFPSLGLMATPLKGQTLDLLKKKEFKTSKETEQLLSLLQGIEDNIDIKGNDEKKKDDNTCVHQIGEIEINDASKKGFKILVDGVVYGKFVKIKIRKSLRGNSEGLALPFMHFLAPDS